MAKYTELFADYLANGGTLPAVFATIEGFETKFIQHYCDKELGFETETLFALKLEEKANIYVPLYKERIDSLATALNKIKTPSKVFSESNTITDTIGAQDSNIKNVPFNAENANPSQINHADESVNERAEEREHTESGFTADEAIRTYNFLNEQIHSIEESLLNEFKDLFMRIF